ncbi:unnamed protein product [Caenorhabditis auriculariae]|uniref:Uncharacterized protein n=1 Tax=Caenorhabditis auriculariae TaxID=2777116 RepID=A0A8S1H2B7_9PELO|nr:unnamed protein product [Caenorhabditis auriculariae]
MEDATLGQNLRCFVCEAQATGFHFGAQSCSACAAFFRRTVSMKKQFVCITGRDDCLVHYTMHQICRSCRVTKCTENGMKPSSVQPKRQTPEAGRSFFTKSGLKRNKMFSAVEALNDKEEQLVQGLKRGRESRETASELEAPSTAESSPRLSSSQPSPRLPPNCSQTSSPRCSTPKYLGPEGPDVLECLVREEMKLYERRRIMFCERPVEKLLGLTPNCPYTKEDLRPLSFRAFRKSIRTHILLIYEWLQAWPGYQELDNNDKVSFLRKCVLFHTILDPVYISIQIGYPERFVMQNGGYVSCIDGCDEGWEDEKEISGKNKRLIYQPLLKRIMEEIIPPMIALNLSFEEFVALKAFVSWQGALPDTSVEKRDVMKRQLDAVTNSLHSHYKKNGVPAAERLGSIILLLSNIFSTGLDFVVSHRQIEFFDLWNLDSLLLQLLNLDMILEGSTSKKKSNAR